MLNPNNPIFNQMFGGFNNFQNNFSQFMQSFGNGNPQAVVQQMLNNGQMSQQQFEQCRQLANQIMGNQGGSYDQH